METGSKPLIFLRAGAARLSLMRRGAAPYNVNQHSLLLSTLHNRVESDAREKNYRAVGSSVWKCDRARSRTAPWPSNLEAEGWPTPW